MKKNSRVKSVEAILKREGVPYKIKGVQIITECMPRTKADILISCISAIVSTEAVELTIKRNVGTHNEECILTIDTGIDRETVLKALEGIGYRENYGYFVTEFNELYITDDLGIEQEQSLYQLQYEEDKLVGEIKRYFEYIRGCNRQLRSINVLNERFSEVLEIRQKHIDELEKLKNQLLVVRSDIKKYMVENLGVK